MEASQQFINFIDNRINKIINEKKSIYTQTAKIVAIDTIYIVKGVYLTDFSRTAATLESAITVDSLWYSSSFGGKIKLLSYDFIQNICVFAANGVINFPTGVSILRLYGDSSNTIKLYTYSTTTFTTLNNTIVYRLTSPNYVYFNFPNKSGEILNVNDVVCLETKGGDLTTAIVAYKYKDERNNAKPEIFPIGTVLFASTNTTNYFGNYYWGYWSYLGTITIGGILVYAFKRIT